MLQRYKNLISYIFVIIIAFLLVKGCDFITKKPTPVDRTLDQRIQVLTTAIKEIKKEMVIEKRQRDSVDVVNNGIIDRRINDIKKTNRQNEILKNTPDSALIHSRDSIKRANNL